MNGTWEGDIRDPQRPDVVTIDFDGGTASLSGGPAAPMTTRPNPSDASSVEVSIAARRPLTFCGTLEGDSIVGTFRSPDAQFPLTLLRVPALQPAAGRITAWQQDIDVVLTRSLRYDRSFDERTRAAARSRLELLRQTVGSRTDAEVMVELSRSIALSGNAHTRLYFVRNRTEVRRLPVRVWWFGNEPRIVRAAADHRSVLGCRVTRLGERSIA